MNIGEAAAASGMPVKTVRFYADIALLKPVRRNNGYRDFSGNDVHKLAFLGKARSLGFSIDDCRTLLSLYEDRGRASAEVKQVASVHLERIEKKIRELEAMRGTLQTLVERCHGDERPDCPILEGLASAAASPGRRL